MTCLPAHMVGGMWIPWIFLWFLTHPHGFPWCFQQDRMGAIFTDQVIQATKGTLGMMSVCHGMSENRLYPLFSGEDMGNNDIDMAATVGLPCFQILVNL